MTGPSLTGDAGAAADDDDDDDGGGGARAQPFFGGPQRFLS